MRLVIKRGSGIRTNPLQKSDEQQKGKHKHQYPRLLLRNAENNENLQSLDHGGGVISTEIPFDGFESNMIELKSDEAKNNSTEKGNLDHDSDDDNGSMKQSCKQKLSPWIIDHIINGSSKTSSIATSPKVVCFDTSIPSQGSEEKNFEHTLSKIPATDRKKWSQKRCVLCRKYGVRKDTRYICVPCNVPLCKEPCFSVHHSNT